MITEKLLDEEKHKAELKLEKTGKEFFDGQISMIERLREKVN